MELMKAIEDRRSIRKFKKDLVPDTLINDLLDAARLAPSGTNIQPWRFVVIKSEEGKAKIGQATSLAFVTAAPVVIACCVDTQAIGDTPNRMKELAEAGAFSETQLESPNPELLAKKSRSMDEAAIKAYLNLNLAIAMEHMVLRATDLGLGTCWVMMFDPDVAHLVLALEERYKVIALLPVGYPDQDPAQRPRIGLNEIVLKTI